MTRDLQFGAWVRGYLDAADVREGELANKLGIDDSTVARWIDAGRPQYALKIGRAIGEIAAERSRRRELQEMRR